MIARCPACAQCFPIVGSCSTSCPFCGADVEIAVRRAGHGTSSSVSSGRMVRREVAAGSNASGPVTIETLAEEDVQKLVERETNGLMEEARREALRRARYDRANTPIPQTAWDARPGLRSFFSTWRAAVFSPRAFFDGLSAEAPRTAIAFALLVLVPGALVHVLGADLWLAHRGVHGVLPTSKLLLGAAVTLPLLLVYFVATYHAGATLLRQRRLRMSGVVRATCYGFAPMLLAIVPVVGLAIGIVGSLVLHQQALERHLGLARWQSLVALAMPVGPIVALVLTS